MTGQSTAAQSITAARPAVTPGVVAPAGLHAPLKHGRPRKSWRYVGVFGEFVTKPRHIKTEVSGIFY